MAGDSGNFAKALRCVRGKVRRRLAGDLTGASVSDSELETFANFGSEPSTLRSSLSSATTSLSE
eukprot:8464608-Pyramimonas_sp.AAC.1